MNGNQKYIVGVKFINTKINGSVLVRAVTYRRNIHHRVDNIPCTYVDACM